MELVDPRDDRAERNRDKDATWRFVEMHLPPSIVKGLELSVEMADLARRSTGADVVVGDFMRLDPTAERYDLIALRHVLEHLPDSRS